MQLLVDSKPHLLALTPVAPLELPQHQQEVTTVYAGVPLTAIAGLQNTSVSTSVVSH